MKMEVKGTDKKDVKIQITRVPIKCLDIFLLIRQKKLRKVDLGKDTQFDKYHNDKRFSVWTVHYDPYQIKTYGMEHYYIVHTERKIESKTKIDMMML